MANRVYIASFYKKLTPAISTLDSEFRIESPGREIKIRSITLTWWMYNISTIQIIPWRSNTTQNLLLQVGPLQPDIGYAFKPTGGTTPTRSIFIHEPGQYHYDGFFIANQLRFELNITNSPAIDDINHRVTIIVETEEQTMFNQ